MALSEHPLSVTFAARKQVTSAARAESSALEIFFPTRQNLPLGRQLKLTVAFQDAKEVFEMSGRVSFLRAASATNEPGVVVAFDAVQRVRAIEFLAYCERDLGPERAISKRVYTKLKCRLIVNGSNHPGEVFDLSATGAFIIAPKFPKLKPGTKVEMQFKAGLFSWGKSLEMRIVWNGEKRGQPGFGGRFVGDLEVIAGEVNKFLTSPR